MGNVSSKTTLYFSEKDVALFTRMNDLKKKRNEPKGSMSGYARQGINLSGMMTFLNMTVSQGAMVALSKGMFDSLTRMELENGHIVVGVKEDCYTGDGATLKGDIAELREFLG